MSKRIHTDRKKNEVGKHWSAKDRVRAVAAYLVLGNMSRVEEQTGIPVGTLNYWKTQPWWYEQIERIRQAEDQELDNTFTKIVKKTQEVILDRMENGDFFVDKEGTLRRRPVSMRDAAIVGAIGIDKRKVLREAHTDGETKIGMQERLKNLELQFKKLAKKEEPNIIDVTPIEDENGEKELQEGIRTGIEGTKGSTSPEESGTTDHDEERSGESGGWEGRGTQEGDIEGGLEHLGESEDGGPQEESFFRPA